MHQHRPSVASRTAAGRRSGLTLIECLVVFVVIAILSGLLLTAVQSARESSRRVHCLSNIRQLGLALNSYAALHGVFPVCQDGLIGDPRPNRFSYVVRLLPHLGETARYARFDLSKDLKTQWNLVFDRPAVIVCPSDLSGVAHAGHSYFGNVGWLTFNPSDDPGVVKGVAGVIAADKPVSLAAITDGLSQTAAIAEFLPTVRHDSRRAVWSENRTKSGWHFSPSELASACLAAETYHYDFPRGWVWATGGCGNALYDHVLPPNSRNCGWVFTAGSNHSVPGVNTAMCDGSARFVSSSVDVGVWRALGSKDGDENRY